MTAAQLEMAAQAIAKENGCDLTEGCPGAEMGKPCLCESFARVALRAADQAALCETP
jgi:hypothetical protein